MNRFPPSFLFGTATSATQIEGGCTTSGWYEFAREPGRVAHGDRPDVACDAWHRWEGDVALQKSLGLDAHRMSIEWARSTGTRTQVAETARFGSPMILRLSCIILVSSPV